MGNHKQKKNTKSKNKSSVYDKVYASDIEAILEVEGKEIDISQELVVAFTMGEIEHVNSLLNYVFSHMTEDELEIIHANLKRLAFKDLLIWSASNAGLGIERVIILAILTSKTKLARTCLATLADGFVYRFKRYEKIDGAEIKEGSSIDFDKYAFAVSMEWAMKNRLITRLKFDIEAVDGIETYMKFKKGEIKYSEFIKYLVTDGGKLPMPLSNELYTNPNYSWSGFNENNIEDCGFNDDYVVYIQSIFQRHYSCVRDIATGECLLHLYGRYSIIHGGNYKNLKNLLKKSTEKISNLEDKYKEIRTELKKVKNNSRSTVDELNKVSNKMRNLEVECDKLRESSVTTEELNKLKQSYKNKCSELDSLLKEKDKIINKQDNEIDELKEENVKLMVENDAIEKSFKAYKDNSSIVNMSIPVEILVRSMRDKRIVVIGGDLTHNKLRGLGFNNLRLIETDRRTVSNSEIANADVIVFYINYLAHSLMEFPKQYANQNNIPIIYFTGKNLELLCNELFMQFYS